MTPDERFAHWVGWIERIKNAGHTLFLHRYVFQTLGEITRAADLPPSVAFDAISSWYGSAQAVAVRRQVDRRRDTISLARLLEEIAENQSVMSRERHIALWRTSDPDLLAEANTNFDWFAGVGCGFIDRNAVREDITRLDAAAEAIQRYASEAVAHSAKDPSKELPTWAELHAAIEVIGDLVAKYYSLLTATSIWSMLPEIQYDWLAAFRQPWMSHAGSSPSISDASETTS